MLDLNACVPLPSSHVAVNLDRVIQDLHTLLQLVGRTMRRIVELEAILLCPSSNRGDICGALIQPTFARVEGHFGQLQSLPVIEVPQFWRVAEIKIGKDARELVEIRGKAVVETKRHSEGSVRRRGHLVSSHPHALCHESGGLDAGDLEEHEFGIVR